LRDVDVVCHLAAELRGLPGSLFLNNVVGSRNLLEAAVEFRPEKIVFVSSISVYEVAGLAAAASVDEDCPLERFPERRDLYTHCKVWQERLFQDYRSKGTFESVTLRPGVIYGEGRDPLFARLGIEIGKGVFQLAPDVTLPLTYVENCASAVVFAIHSNLQGRAYNVVDDETPTAREYLRQYKKYIKDAWCLRSPKPLTYLASYCVEACSRYSHGQIPPFLTPYKVRSMWTLNRFDNGRIKAAGWVQPVPTGEAIRRTLLSAYEASLASSGHLR
jgi:nucleoside-diphosphate-sugar epimerase